MSNWGILMLNIIKGFSEVAIVGSDVQTKRRVLAREFLPFTIFSGCETSSELPLLNDKTPVNGETAIYVCYNKTCKRPVTSVEQALTELH
jgi:uncharacterized protein YyaL (SSP411 family)